jgi:hypothetical protein
MEIQGCISVETTKQIQLQYFIFKLWFNAYLSLIQKNELIVSFHA